MVTRRLPRWVEWGAWLLAFNAGGVNAVGLLSLQHQSISHVTGSVSWLALAAAQAQLGQALYLGAVVLGFLSGAVFSGWLIRDEALRLGHRYSACLVVEALLLILAWWSFAAGNLLGAIAASTACGVQNAMVTTYSGAVLRTTHLTGALTDIGLLLGHRLRGIAIDRRRLRLHLLVLLGFLAGAIGGSLAWLRLGFTALWLPVTICLGLALAYTLYRRRQAPRAGAV